MKNNIDIELRSLSESDKAVYDNFIQEFRGNREKIIPSSADNKGLSYKDWFEKRRKNAKGIDLSPDRVPSTVYFLFNKESGKILGAADIRHELNESLLRDGGNIGYGVAPSERRKGYASYMFKEILEKCKATGMKRALITCDKTNIGSAKTIMKNGGILEDEVLNENGVLKQRYRITL